MSDEISNLRAERDEAIRRYDAIRQIDARVVQAESRVRELEASLMEREDLLRFHEEMTRRLQDALRQYAIGLDGHYVHCPGEKFHGRPEHDCYAIQACETVRALLARIDGGKTA